MTIEIKAKFYGEEIAITGYVDGGQVMTIYVDPDRSAKIEMSSCLPTNIDLAEAFVLCMNRTFEKYHQVINEKKKEDG